MHNSNQKTYLSQEVSDAECAPPPSYFNDHREFLLRSNEGFVLKSRKVLLKKFFTRSKLFKRETGVASAYETHPVLHMDVINTVSCLIVFHRIVNVSIPKKTRNNGTLYALIFVHQAGVTPWQDPRQVHMVAHLTTYMVPKPPEISLISRDDQAQVTESVSSRQLAEIYQ